MAAERRRILLVDPDLELLRIRQYLLAGCSYLVQAACDYRDVFQNLTIGEPHVAILNHSMGEVDLKLIAEHIRQRWPQVRILIIDQRFPALEDRLYDEAVDARFKPREFLIALDRCYRSSLMAVRIPPKQNVVIIERGSSTLPRKYPESLPVRPASLEIPVAV